MGLPVPRLCPPRPRRHLPPLQISSRYGSDRVFVPSSLTSAILCLSFLPHGHFGSSRSFVLRSDLARTQAQHSLSKVKRSDSVKDEEHRKVLIANARDRNVQPPYAHLVF